MRHTIHRLTSAMPLGSILAALVCTASVAHWVPAPAAAQLSSVDEIAQFDPIPVGDGVFDDRFGSGLAMDGNLAVVGAPKSDGRFGIDFSGAHATVFVREGEIWSHAQTLQRSIDEESGGYGSDVALTDDVIFVSAPASDDDRGAVHIYTRDADGGPFLERQRLALDASEPNRRFGLSLVAQGGTLIVASYADTGFSAGSLHVFSRSVDGFDLVQTLEAPNPLEGDLALDQTTVLVGSSREEAVWHYENVGGTWTGPTTIESPSTFNESFGAAVDLDGDTAVIGAPDAETFSVGTAYIFRRIDGVFVFEQQITDPDGVRGDELGTAVAIDSDRIAIGVPSRRGLRPARTIALRRDGGIWVDDQVLEDCEDSDVGGFGQALALRGDHALVGTPFRIGHVCTFTESGGVFQGGQLLRSLPNIAGYRFGSALALRGDHALIAAPNTHTDTLKATGSVFAFDRTPDGVWVSADTITSPQPFDQGQFGAAIHIADSMAVIGMPGNADGEDSAAFVYERIEDQWQLVQRIEKATAGIGYSHPRFGRAVWHDGGRMLIGAPDEAAVYPGSGTTVAFEHDGVAWRRTQFLRAPGIFDGERFGSSLAVDGDRALITSRGEDYLYFASGSVWSYIHRDGMWEFEQRFTPDDLPLGQGLFAIALRGDTAAVAAIGRFYILTRVGGVWQQQQRINFHVEALHFRGKRLFAGIVDDEGGSVRVFEKDESDLWQDVDQFRAQATAAGDSFGSGIAGDATTMVVGARRAPAADPEGTIGRGGAAYIFEIDRVFSDGFETGTTAAWSSTTRNARRTN